MDETTREAAKFEIKRSLKWSNFCTRMVGIDFYEEAWRSNPYWSMGVRVLLLASALGIVWVVVGELAFIIMTMVTSPRIEDVVSLIHLWGYALLSLAKMLTIWHKKAVFKQLLTGLEEIWPTSPLAPSEQQVKDASLESLRLMHFWYFWVNVSGVWSYILTPAVLHAYLVVAGRSGEMGSPWRVLYPYDRHGAGIRELTYAWEAFMGLCAVWTMVGPDLLFSALASHIGMLLRLLNLRLRSVAPAQPQPASLHSGGGNPADHFDEIVDIIKLHQKLIKYCSDIEDAFSFVFLINIVLSSINICCAGFICILVEPLLSPSNKLFLMASLSQIGVLCWYGDDICRVNAEVGAAAYAGGWYRCDARCRSALRFLILSTFTFLVTTAMPMRMFDLCSQCLQRRSQKPLTFTAMKFKYIDLFTYTSILTTSYSYFALLSTMYKDKFSEH